MTSKLNRQKQKTRSWRSEYNNLRTFILQVMGIAARRELGYLMREHGDIVNKNCADDTVSLCKMFCADQFEAKLEKLYKRALRNKRSSDAASSLQKPEGK